MKKPNGSPFIHRDYHHHHSAIKFLPATTNANFFTDKGWVKFYRVPGAGPSTGGEDFFFEKKGDADFFREKLGGRRLFLLQNFKIQDFILLEKLFLKIIKSSAFIGV